MIGRMKVLVIGGTQFIGRCTVEGLVLRGHHVTVLHRHPQHDLGPEVGNVQGDRGDLEAMSRILGTGRFDAVLDFVYDWENGTTGDQVAAAARSCGPQLQRYLFVSSIAAYGAGVDHREDEPLVGDDYPDSYSANKAASERALWRMHAETGFPATTFRPPFVHGPRQPFYREQFFWDRLLAGRPLILPDGGDAPMQWVFVSDLAEACVRAIEVPEAAGQAFNLAHVEPLTQRTFLELLARVAGVSPTFASIPRAAIREAGGHVFMGNLYFGQFLDIPVHTTVVEKAPRVLGITPTPIERAFAETFAWYQRQPPRPVDYAFEDRLLAASRS
jgi:nucleoside-diphosphate-sugar epimerase